ncbi:MAG TPA: ester cyclase [Candidatus Dormibacteraeota bacterium]|nr:ester cyclase [Candidatus Dormibacteraeota bacterium]
MPTPRELLDYVIDALNSKDEERYIKFVGPEFELRAPGGVTVRGKEGFRNWHQTWTEACPDCTVQCHNAVSDPTQVIWEGTFTGTHTGVLHLPSGDVPPTGKHVTVDYAGAMRVAGREIAYWRDYFDSMEMMVQLGLVGAEARA